SMHTFVLGWRALSARRTRPRLPRPRGPPPCSNSPRGRLLCGAGIVLPQRNSPLVVGPPLVARCTRSCRVGARSLLDAHARGCLALGDPLRALTVLAVGSCAGRASFCRSATPLSSLAPRWLLDAHVRVGLARALCSTHTPAAAS